MLKRWIPLPLLALGLYSVVSAGGCTVQTEPVRILSTAPTQPLPSGTLTVRWTIDEVTDPNECIQAVVADLELSVFDHLGLVATFREVCESFGLSVALIPGDYDASAILLDGVGRPRTTRLDITPFTIFGNDVLDVPIDFPASSFLY